MAAGEQAGILDTLLDRLATYKEKILAIKGKIKARSSTRSRCIVVAFVITAVIMIFVIPVFKDLFKSFGADLPGAHAVRDDMSDFFVAYWWLIFGTIGGGLWFFFYTWKRSAKMQAVHGPPDAAAAGLRRRDPQGLDRALVPHAVHHVRRRRAAGGVARFGGGRRGQLRVLRGHQEDPDRGLHRHQPHGGDAEHRRASRTWCCRWWRSARSPGSLDAMLSKVADFFEQEVDDAVDALACLMEPMIMVVLGGLIGGMVVAMYLPIFKMGQAI